MLLEPSQITILGLLLLVFILLGWIVYLEMRLRRIFRGKKAADFETIIADIGKALDDLFSKSDAQASRLTIAEKKLRRTLGKFHTIRFNPFKDQGGNQSFATCLMDDEGNGVVVSSIYSRDKVSVYAKPLEKHKSQFELTEEEKIAIKEAANR